MDHQLPKNTHAQRPRVGWTEIMADLHLNIDNGLWELTPVNVSRDTSTVASPYAAPDHGGVMEHISPENQF